MAKQIYNTRGMDLGQVKEILQSMIVNARQYYEKRIEYLEKELERER